MKKIFSILSIYCLWVIGSYVFIDLIFGGLQYYLRIESKPLEFLLDNTLKLALVFSTIITAISVIKKWILDKQLSLIKWIYGCALGLSIMPYGISKILRAQFVVLPFWMWRESLENIPGTALTWSFLGYSPWFQILLGYLELIPALLLLFTRTRFLGSLLMLPMTLNVFLINWALDLWSGTKLLSTEFLALNIILILLEWRRVRDIIKIVLGKWHINKSSSWQVMVSLIFIAGFGYLSLRTLLDYKSQNDFLTGDWINRNPNEWYLKSAKQNDSTVSLQDPSKLYFSAYGSFREVIGTGPIPNGPDHYVIDEKNHLIHLSGKETEDKASLNILNDSTLERIKVTDSIKNVRLTQIFSRRIINKTKSE